MGATSTKRKSRLKTLKDSWLAEEERILRETFEVCAWSLTEAAKLLSCERSALQRVMKRHADLDEERQDLMAYGSGGGERSSASKGRAA